MPTFLSPAWIDALAQAAERHEPGEDLEGMGPLVIEHLITRSGGDDPVTYHVSLRDGQIAVQAGPAEQADVTFTLDERTARDINAGTVSAQAAFMTGRLRIGGDAMSLMSCQPALAALGDLFGSVRAETEY